MPKYIAHHSQAGPKVPAGRSNDALPRAQVASTKRVLDDGSGGPILDASAGLQEFSLRENSSWPLKNPFESNQSRVTD
jgi:hypothetical protein